MTSRYSHLFVPATKADTYFKKLDTNHDDSTLPYVVVFDLEDSIGGAFKDSARELLRNTIATHFSRYGQLFRWYIRINPSTSPWFSDDLALLREFSDYRIGLRLPKCRDREDLVAVEEYHSPTAPVIPAIETLQGYSNRDRICEYCSKIQVRSLGFGAGDLSMELGIERDYSLPVLQHLYCALLITTRRHGLNLFDTPSRVLPSADTACEEQLADECFTALENGFTGKGAVHPSQVKIIESVFSSNSKIAWAKKLLWEFEKKNDPATRAVRSKEDNTYAGTPSLKYAKWILKNRG
jgi:citrate lyase beta subunit